jgi:hypothetical protein
MINDVNPAAANIAPNVLPFSSRNAGAGINILSSSTDAANVINSSCDTAVGLGATTAYLFMSSPSAIARCDFNFVTTVASIDPSMMHLISFSSNDAVNAASYISASVCGSVGVPMTIPFM